MTTPTSPSTARRTVLLGAAAGTVAVAASVANAGASNALDASRATDPLPRRGPHAHDRDRFAYVGSRTTAQRRARGEGVTVWRLPARTTRWTLIQTVPADNGTGRSNAGAAPVVPVNPSFLTLDAAGTRLYCVHGDASSVSVFSVDTFTGRITFLQTVDVGRRNPVHVTIDPTGSWLVLATLAVPGAVLTLPIGADGRLGAVASVLELPGTPGPHKLSQLGPNPHHAVFDPTGRWLAVADRGLDRVFIASLEPATGRLRLNDPGWALVREMEGPRHLAFNPRRDSAYLVSELRCDITTCDFDPRAGTLSPVQVVPSQPPTFTADVRGGEIQVSPSGRYVYSSNRSGAGDETPGGPDDDTIGVFKVDRRTGTLTPYRWLSTHGIRPRFFGLTPSGRGLFAANEVSDTIVGFDLDSDGAPRRDNGVVARTPSPVCIVFSD